MTAIVAGEDLFRFQCKAMSLPPVTEQFEFAKPMGRKFKADFCFEPWKLIIEVNGGVWLKGGGAHSRPAKIEGDMERQQYAVRMGYFVLPFTPAQVKSGHAVNWTRQVLINFGWRP